MPANHDREQAKQSSPDQALLVQTLSMIDQNDGGHRAWNGRDPRFCPAYPEANAIIEHPGGSKVTIPVVIYNISASGAGLATRVYLHRLTPITLELITHDGEVILVDGQVQWCEYYENVVHRTGIRFSDKIQPRYFVDPDVWMRESVDDGESLWATDRKALHVEEDRLEANAITMLAKNANIECENAVTIGQAADLVQANSYDLVLLSDTLSNENAVEAVSHLRTSGYSGPIFVLTTSAHCREDAFSGLGVNAILSKPVQLVPMMSALRDLFEQETTLSGTQPIYSTLTAAQCSTHALEEYLALTAQCALKLDEVLKTDDLSVALKLCTSLHSSGAGFGYQELSATASDVIQSLNASCSVRESAVKVRSLIRFLSRLKSRPSDGSEQAAA
jgi:DNA-binding response OmpR family regulator